jgi:hypothetical protein
MHSFRCQGTKAIIHPVKVQHVDVYGHNVSIVKFRNTLRAVIHSQVLVRYMY